MILIVSSVILILFFEKMKVPAALLTGTLVASGFFAKSQKLQVIKYLLTLLITVY